MSKEMIQNIRLHKETKCQAQEKTGSSFKERFDHLQWKSVQSNNKKIERNVRER